MFSKEQNETNSMGLVLNTGHGNYIGNILDKMLFKLFS